MSSAKAPIKPKTDVVVFTTTFYSSPSDTRCQIAVLTLLHLAKKGIPTVVIDASPANSGVLEVLRATGAIVEPQTQRGGKGVALREALTLAADLPGVTQNTWLCFQEPEKVDLPRHWDRIFRSDPPLVGLEVGIVVPRRMDESFKETYPIEQYHEEMIGNMYLDTVARDSIASLSSSNNLRLPRKLPPLDWMFGPFALRLRHAHIWLSHTGQTYDAQIVPLIRAVRLGVQVESIDINFSANKDMKIMEEGNANFIEKRVHQLSLWEGLIKTAWTEDFSSVTASSSSVSSRLTKGQAQDPLMSQFGLIRMLIIGAFLVVFWMRKQKKFPKLHHKNSFDLSSLNGRR